MLKMVTLPGPVLICMAVKLLFPGMFTAFYELVERLLLTQITDLTATSGFASLSSGKMLLNPLGALMCPRKVMYGFCISTISQFLPNAPLIKVRCALSDLLTFSCRILNLFGNCLMLLLIQ
jgi:hypothetical protein